MKKDEYHPPRSEMTKLKVGLHLLMEMSVHGYLGDPSYEDATNSITGNLTDPEWEEM